MQPLGEILRNLTSTSEASTDDSSDAEEETFRCPLCHDRGWITYEAPLGDPRFGKAFPCQCTVQHFEAGRRERLLRQANLGSLAHLTFANLISQGRSSHPKNQARFSQAVESARRYALCPEGWLVLGGPSGCGKTHLAAAVANERLSRGEPVLFMVVPDLLDHLRATYSPQSETVYDEVFEQLRTAPFLILDDLGSEASTSWAQEKLYQLINQRYNSRLPTLFTLGRSLEELEERLHTRLGDANLSQVCFLEENLPPLFQHLGGLGLEFLSSLTFEAFQASGLHLPQEVARNLQQAFRLARSFAESPDGWLAFLGGHGCGKTHLAAAIANHRIGRGEPVFFATVPDLLDHLRATFSPQSQVSYDELFERLRGAPLLILDDLGTQTINPWTQEKLYQLLNFRYQAPLPTVITSALSLDEIGRLLGQGISSRLVDARRSTVFHIMAPDYRGDARPKDTPKASPTRPSRPRTKRWQE